MPEQTTQTPKRPPSRKQSKKKRRVKLVFCVSCGRQENKHVMVLLMDPYTGKEKYQCFECYDKGVKAKGFYRP